MAAVMGSRGGGLGGGLLWEELGGGLEVQRDWRFGLPQNNVSSVAVLIELVAVLL